MDKNVENNIIRDDLILPPRVGNLGADGKNLTKIRLDAFKMYVADVMFDGPDDSSWMREETTC